MHCKSACRTPVSPCPTMTPQVVMSIAWVVPASKSVDAVSASVTRKRRMSDIWEPPRRERCGTGLRAADDSHEVLLVVQRYLQPAIVDAGHHRRSASR